MKILCCMTWRNRASLALKGGVRLEAGLRRGATTDDFVPGTPVWSPPT